VQGGQDLGDRIGCVGPKCSEQVQYFLVPVIDFPEQLSQHRDQQPRPSPVDLVESANQEQAEASGLRCQLLS
jgi:hypothetical protein